jgi:hypothetical protein
MANNFLTITCHAEGGCHKDVVIPTDKVSVIMTDKIPPNPMGIPQVEELSVLAKCSGCNKPTVSTYLGELAMYVQSLLEGVEDAERGVSDSDLRRLLDETPS